MASAQHGLVARRQLLAMGFGPEAIKSMKRAGWLHVVHRGVYAVGHRPVTANTVRMAAVLACGPGALRMIDQYGLPRPEVNVRIACGSGELPEVDLLWRRERLVLEPDGGRFHSSRSQIERDRRTESLLVQAGYRVLRATWWQVQHDPRDVALMLRAALAA
jgi:hypothetical protein